MALRQEEFTRLCDDVDLDRDRVLVERCQAGDPGAFGSLYARYYERLLRFCLRRLHDRHEAEDAAQEAFARAWKALPKFAGERRFYPWLTVIAGNICTDMLRRRSRSTPTEDVELAVRLPVGATGGAPADEVIIAAVDGELAHKALDRLSLRHRHVLAMREDSGWTYQQMADHEGVEIGTIETLLWRARQALKREFTVLSQSKGPFAGILIGAGAAVRTLVMRSAHRIAGLQPGGGGGAFRGAVAGFAVTSAAVAAVVIAPHAFNSPHQAQVALPAPAAGTVRTNLPRASVTPSAGSATGGRSTPSRAHTAAGGSDGAGTVARLTPTTASAVKDIQSDGSGLAAPVAGTSDPSLSLLPEELLEPVTSGASSATGAITGAVSGALGASPLKSLVPATIGAVTTTVGGLSAAIGSGSASLLGSPSSSGATSTTPASTTTATVPAIGNAVSSVLSAISSLPLLGQR